MTTLSSTLEMARLRQALRDPHQRRLLGSTRASVALILRPSLAGAELLVIRRATREGDPWSGHMGLPGGHRDEDDRDDCQTAIRETREELGLDLATSAELIGTLDDVQASARGQTIDLVVSCFVFLVGASPSLTLNEEVAETLWIPLASISDGRLSTSHHVTLDGQTRALPGWKVEGHIIWGLTYRIISNLLHRLRSMARIEDASQ